MSTLLKSAPVSLCEEWQNHQRSFERLLLSAIETTDRWISQIDDPEIGPAGQIFRDQFIRSGCRQDIDLELTGSIALYTSFCPTAGFLNHIVYGPKSVLDLGQLASSKVHEGAHGLQKMMSAALHASPFNPFTRIVVRPRDWVILEERCEQGAYALQAWFNALLAHDLPILYETTRADPVSAAGFDDLRARKGNLGDALAVAALECLDRDWNGTSTFRRHYQQSALRNFGIGLRQRRDRGNLIFVRIEPEDIAAVGRICGISSFGDTGQGVNSAFLADLTLHPQEQEALDGLNQEFGIADEDALPSLRDALAANGMNRAQFIAATHRRTRDLLQCRPG